MSWNKINLRNLKKSTHYNRNTNLDLFLEFIKYNKIISSRSCCWFGTTIKRFLENGGVAAGKTYIHLRNEIPNMDHEYMYKNSDGEVFITSHSYSSNEEIKKSFEKWNDGSFKLTIFGVNKSWYNPYETTLFVITLKDVNVNYYQKND